MVATPPPRTYSFARRQIAPSGEAGRGLARSAAIIGAVGTTAQVTLFIVRLSLLSSALSTSGVFG